MRHCQPEKAHRTTKSGHRSRQQRRRNENQRTRSPYIQPHGLSIILAEQKKIQGLDTNHRQQQPEENDRSHYHQLGDGYMPQRSHRP